MEETLVSLIRDFTPLSAIGLSLVIIYYLIRNQQSVKNIKENHLHEVIDQLQRLNETASRLESGQNQVARDIIYIKTKINGKDI